MWLDLSAAKPIVAQSPLCLTASHANAKDCEFGEKGKYQLENTMQLSPLNFSGLIQNINQTGDTTQTTTNGRVREIVMYECCECYERHEDEDDAADCCAEVFENTDCPVCKSKCTDHRDATDCCLWKDFDAPTRWAMADKVYAGATWAEVLNVKPH